MHCPDITQIDLQMPEMNGFETVKSRVKSILSKLGAHDPTHAASSYAIQP